MKKTSIVGVSIVVLVLLVLSSLTNVIGYQQVQSSNQNTNNDMVNQKELLFQTILDISNNKEIQKVILGSEITGKRFFDPGMRFSLFNHPVLTEKFLKRMYTMGVILSKTISKSKIKSMFKQYQFSNPGMQKEITAIIQQDTILKSEMNQLLSLSCDCENENTTVWKYPILCTILLPIAYIIAMMWYFSLIILYHVPPFIQLLFDTIKNIVTTLDCYWLH
jgi:hypothetical protein